MEKWMDTYRLRSASPNATQKPKYVKLLFSPRKRTHRIENQIYQVRPLQHAHTPKDLGQRRQGEGPRAEPEQEDGHDQLLGRALGDVVLVADVVERGDDHGRGEGREEGEERDEDGGGPLAASGPVEGVLGVVWAVPCYLC